MSNEKFDFYIDKKITMWVREHHTIECTETDMEPGDNGGQSTAELFYSDTDELLTTNIQ